MEYKKKQLIEMIESNKLLTKDIKYKGLTKAKIIESLLKKFSYKNGKFYYARATKQ